jgi:hypothetical protein
MKKIVSLLLIVCTFLLFGSTYVLATTPSMPTPGGTPPSFVAPIGQILGAIQSIGYAFAVGMLIVLGIKYVMASAQEKADLKKGMLSYVIGAIMIAGAATIPGVIAGMISW